MKKSTKTALITGASKGIGRAFAKKYAQMGYNLILVARSKEKLQQVKKECKTLTNEVLALAVDLTTPHIAEDIFKTIKRKNLTVDVLVNNAGFGDKGKFKTAKLAKQSEMIQLNITALTELSYAFLQQTSTSKPSQLVNIASTAAFIPGPTMSVYFATKAYVLSFTEALASELEGSKTSVTCVCPGATQSEFAKRAHVKFDGNIATAEDLVEYAYAETVHKTVVAIHGGENRALTFLTRILPRSVVRNIAKKQVSKL